MATKKKKSKPTASKKRTPFRLSRQNKIILGSLLILLSIALFFSFISFYFTWQEDQSLLSEFANRNEQAKNLLNKFGASVSHYIMYKGFGIASFILPFLLCITGLYMFLSIPKKGLWGKWIWGLLLLIWTSIALGFFAEQQPLLGGLVGYEMNDFLQDYTGKIGVFLILLFMLTIIMVRLFKLTPEGIASFFKSKSASVVSDFKNKEEAPATLLKDEENEITLDTYTHKKDIPPLNEDSKEFKDILDQKTVSKEEEIAMEVSAVAVEKEEKDILSDKLVADFGEFDPTLELSNYKFPHLDLLEQHGFTGGITINQEELEENKNKIVDTLKNYKIGIAQIKATIGPTVTLYEIVPEAGIRISKIKNLEDDIALIFSRPGDTDHCTHPWQRYHWDRGAQ